MEVKQMQISPITDFLRMMAGKLYRHEQLSANERMQIGAFYSQFPELVNPYVYTCSKLDCVNAKEHRLLFRNDRDNAFGLEVDGRRACSICKRVANFTEIPLQHSGIS
jgi:hypothetical protein